MDRLGGRALAAVAFLIGLGAGLALLYGFRFLDVWSANVFGGDFSAIWAGGRVLAMGGDPYDPASFVSASSALGVMESATSVYIYPGWVALLLAPLGILPLEQAALVWIALGVVVGAVGLFVLLDAVAPRLPLAHTLLAFTLLGSESGIVAFYSGQFDHLILGLLALSCAWLWTGRSALAGVAAAGMLLKPQLFLVALPAFVVLAFARGDRRFLWALGATVLALAALSTLAAPHWWTEWLRYVPEARATDPRASTLPNALEDTLSGREIGYLVLGATAAAAFAFSPRSRAATAVWLAVSIAVAPYMFVYDHVIVLVPLTIVAGLYADRRPREAIVLVAAGSLVLCVLATLLHAIPGAEHGTLAFNGYAQYVVTLLVVAAAWPFRAAAG